MPSRTCRSAPRVRCALWSGSGRFCLDAQPPPHRGRRRTGRREDDHVAVGPRTFRIAAPPRLDVAQYSVRATAVVLPVVERGAPTDRFEHGSIVDVRHGVTTTPATGWHADTGRAGRWAAEVDRVRHGVIFPDGPCELPEGEPCEFSAVSCGRTCGQRLPAVDSCGQRHGSAPDRRGCDPGRTATGDRSNGRRTPVDPLRRPDRRRIGNPAATDRRPPRRSARRRPISRRTAPTVASPSTPPLRRCPRAGPARRDPDA